MPGGHRTVDAELDRLAAMLDARSAGARVLTYQKAAEALALKPPHVIHRLTHLLERLMDLDAARGAPLRSALVVSKVRGGRPAPGFFDHARALGVLGDTAEDDFHDQQLRALAASAVNRA